MTIREAYEMKKRTNAFSACMAMLLTMLPVLAGCAREPRQASLSAITYNYSDEDLAFVWINGKQAGVAKEAVRPGDVNGGGIMCCINIPQGARQIEVNVMNAKEETFTVMAEIEQPWTKYASYAVVHVLPKRKIVVEISPGDSYPRKDLLDKRLAEIGVEPEVNYPLYMMNSGPSVDIE